jgi:hypothetical protein
MDPDLRHIVVTWDLDEGTGLGVRYGEMPSARAASLLELAASLVREHAFLLDELEDEEVEVEYELGYDETDNEDDE